MDKKTCGQIRKELAKALKSVEKKFGVTCEVGNMTYDDSEVRTKLTLRTNGALTKEEQTYDTYQKIEGLPKRGTILKDASVTYGYNTRARKYPVIVTKNGKQYKMSVANVKLGVIK